eukprot:SAG11_NODE_930_length_6500_cov_4.853304_1_plen_45_part_10
MEPLLASAESALLGDDAAQPVQSTDLSTRMSLSAEKEVELAALKL